MDPLQEKPYQIRYFYLRTGWNPESKGNPVATVAYVEKEGKVVYQLTSYNPHDNFNRKLGKEIALERLNKKPIFLEEDFSNADNCDIMMAIAASIVDSARQRIPDYSTVRIRFRPNDSYYAVSEKAIQAAKKFPAWLQSNTLRKYRKTKIVSKPQERQES